MSGAPPSFEWLEQVRAEHRAALGLAGLGACCAPCGGGLSGLGNAEPTEEYRAFLTGQVAYAEQLADAAVVSAGAARQELERVRGMLTSTNRWDSDSWGWFGSPKYDTWQELWERVSAAQVRLMQRSGLRREDGAPQISSTAVDAAGRPKMGSTIAPYLDVAAQAATPWGQAQLATEGATYYAQAAAPYARSASDAIRNTLSKGKEWLDDQKGQFEWTLTKGLLIVGGVVVLGGVGYGLATGWGIGLGRRVG